MCGENRLSTQDAYARETQRECMWLKSDAKGVIKGEGGLVRVGSLLPGMGEATDIGRGKLESSVHVSKMGGLLEREKDSRGERTDCEGE